ncbi:hypothetical protein TVAG_240130 [Trichomonas vaginalis G3]|uniref:Chromo domain-containing protein n=1 Tax=Trichomonas vaginalis (strain ATCC PRA-98 / G3) TaxID=412133 RepID=A2EFF5_TRIV3|nr:chromobox protein family [Trichomonas vaginalis G3]EAY08652.1 hypothetical protein TVAG_240130 [Trichomonas vaginalis G3]KAI5543855.1 chromobox protein family [Trichomonas vaginalis G3]|eukprot:XP_001320875.1 hypothetical protein [Trichomonas vaginalis G3]
MEEVIKRTYEVEKILDARLEDNGEWMYLIKWKYYSVAFNTWEPKENFDDDEAITNFWTTHSVSEVTAPYKNQYLPKESLELSNFETNKIAKQIYPEVRGENDIESIIGIAKINGQNIFLVKIVNFPKLMRIPSSILRHICPIKIIKFYESKIRQDSAKHNF